MSDRGDRNPATWTRGECYDAYLDMTTRANNLAAENVALAQRMAKLEDVARAMADPPVIVFDGEMGKYRHFLTERATVELIDKDFGTKALVICARCQGSGRIGQPITHKPDCPVTRARAILAEPPIRARLDYGAKEGETDAD